MVIQYVPRHFKVEELVDETTFKKFGNKSFRLLDPRILVSIDRMRKHFNKPIIVNNWKWSKSCQHNYRQWSGLRTSNSPWYSMYSQHTFGRAIDCIIDGISAEEVR